MVLPTGCTHSVGTLEGFAGQKVKIPAADHGTNDWCIIKECIPLSFLNRLTELFRNADDKNSEQTGRMQWLI